MHLAFLDTKSSEKGSKRTSYGYRHMLLLPAAQANLCFFHGALEVPCLASRLNIALFIINPGDNYVPNVFYAQCVEYLLRFCCINRVIVDETSKEMIFCKCILLVLQRHRTQPLFKP